MGGYGALRAPERFAAAASLSGALDVAGLLDREGLGPVLRRASGDAVPPEADLGHLLHRADPTALPALYACCGADDQMADQTPWFAGAAQARGVPVAVDLGPGDHDWGYWGAAVQRGLAWLPLPADVPTAPGDADA